MEYKKRPDTAMGPRISLGMPWEIMQASLPVASGYSPIASTWNRGSGQAGVICESDSCASSREVREVGHWNYPARVGVVSGLMIDGMG